MSNTGGQIFCYDIKRDGVLVANVHNKSDAEFIFAHLADGGTYWTVLELIEVRGFGNYPNFNKFEYNVIEKRWRE